MPGRPKNSLGPLVLFHGCDKDVAEAVLSGQATLQPSENDYDWLGNGIYFWVDSPERALSWANLRRSSPSVIGAFAYPGNCLNLTDYGVMNELALAYEATLGISAAAGTPLPVNSVRENGIFMKRQLDCAVIQMVHKIRESKSMRRTTPSMECLKKASWFIRAQAFVTERMCRSPSATRR